MVVNECFSCRDGIIQADLGGIVTNKTWSYVICKALALAGIYQTRNLLIDLRGARIPVDALAVYYLPPALEYIGLTRLYRIALVMDNHGREYTFYETVFRNRGFLVRMFTDYDEARVWFRPSDSSQSDIGAVA